MVPATCQSSRAAIALVAALLLSACGGRPPDASRAGETSAQEDSGLAPPRIDTVRADSGGVVLSGMTQAGGKVRLASPAGQAIFATAGARGGWSIALPSATDSRIFGLSVTTGGRQAQAEGYVLVTPAGQVALLRAGAGALRIDPPARLGLRAIDFDRGGGLEVSAVVPAGATVIVRLDDSQVAESRADAAGHFEVSLGSVKPIRPGPHRVQVFGDGFSDEALVQVSPAAPLAEGPLRSQLTAAGLRVDWMTPAGGEQSTLLLH